MAVRLAGMPGSRAELHCPVSPLDAAPGLQAVGLQLPVPILRRRLGEHGPSASIVELQSFAAYLATGGAKSFDRVSAHPLEAMALNQPLADERPLL